MIKHLYSIVALMMVSYVVAQPKATQHPALHELFRQNQTITYQALISEYKKLDALSPRMKLLEYGSTDGGYPLHLLVIDRKEKFSRPAQNRTEQAVFLIMNGIHPGESEGIDASLLLAQQMAFGIIPIPDNVIICIIPVYNVDGMLNRRKYTRTNQNGPEEKGFRGNGRNFDLNRDFIKADTRNTLAFYQIYHEWDPDVFLDNHTSNGADYQYTMTLISTQKQKLGGAAANLLYDHMVPALYAGMLAKKWEMTPYVHLFGKAPDEDGYEQFVETPKYSTGYTSLWGTLGFVAETHMLKPYPDRVEATHALMATMMPYIAGNTIAIRKARLADQAFYTSATGYETNYSIDGSQSTRISFKGYEMERVPSRIGSYTRMHYDRNKPYTKEVPYYNVAKPSLSIPLPRAYVIPQSQHQVIDRLKANHADMQRVNRDTTMMVTATYVTKFSTAEHPYEGHYTHYNVQCERRTAPVHLLKGDYIVSTKQRGSRYLAEVLEPQTEDGFFCWNFFDAVLNAKEGFSDYVFEDDAVKLLEEDPQLQKKFDEWKAANPDKITNGREVLSFIFRNSKLYEEEHMRVPVYRLE